MEFSKGILFTLSLEGAGVFPRRDLNQNCQAASHFPYFIDPVWP
jgi:hypothetical protein